MQPAVRWPCSSFSWSCACACRGHGGRSRTRTRSGSGRVGGSNTACRCRRHVTPSLWMGAVRLVEASARPPVPANVAAVLPPSRRHSRRHRRRRRRPTPRRAACSLPACIPPRGRWRRRRWSAAWSWRPPPTAAASPQETSPARASGPAPAPVPAPPRAPQRASPSVADVVPGTAPAPAARLQTAPTLASAHTAVGPIPARRSPPRQQLDRDCEGSSGPPRGLPTGRRSRRRAWLLATGRAELEQLESPAACRSHRPSCCCWSPPGRGPGRWEATSPRGRRSKRLSLWVLQEI
mmetsp:Transcript_101465/g.302648  ORF Transcript_101465/g.302648 Transcript_101465/m.302648 type:complete len:293 (-) Transcript_101465:376-1254(-)